MHRYYFILLIASLMTGCATTPYFGGPMTPAQAIHRLDESPGSFIGTVIMTVKRVGHGEGREAGYVFLDSAQDYRSPLSLNVIVYRETALRFMQTNGTDSLESLQGQSILVRGTIHKSKIDLFSGGVSTGEYYYQNHLDVLNPEQIVTVKSGRSPADPPAIDITTAKLKDYQRANPHNPELADYMQRLQSRIDSCFASEFRLRQQYTDTAISPGRSLHLTVTVFANGTLGADTSEMKRRLVEEPALAKAVLSVLAAITENPEPFSPTLRRSIGASFDYDAYFSIR